MIHTAFPNKYNYSGKSAKGLSRVLAFDWRPWLTWTSPRRGGKPWAAHGAGSGGASVCRAPSPLPASTHTTTCHLIDGSVNFFGIVHPGHNAFIEDAAVWNVIHPLSAFNNGQCKEYCNFFTLGLKSYYQVCPSTYLIKIVKTTTELNELLKLQKKIKQCF